MYKIKEIYYTIQGEGFHTGWPAIFCRFSGCNLWTGREAERHKAICKFCDTDFWGTDGQFGGRYEAESLAEQCYALWPGKNIQPFIVCTGGEPMLQLDEKLVSAFHKIGFYIAIETNGTLPAVDSIDWICMSPKANTEIVLQKGDELKLVYPQSGLDPSQFTDMDFNHFYLQPMYDAEIIQNTKTCLSYCMQHPQWKLSVQTHKYLGIE